MHFGVRGLLQIDAAYVSESPRLTARHEIQLPNHCVGVWKFPPLRNLVHRSPTFLENSELLLFSVLKFCPHPGLYFLGIHNSVDKARIELTMRYSHPAPEHKRKAVELLNSAAYSHCLVTGAEKRSCNS